MSTKPDAKEVEKDPVVLDLCDHGDKLRADQTFHDRNHMTQVKDIALFLARKIQTVVPTLDEHTIEVIIRIAALLHDIGSGIDPKNHASAGAKWARSYLLGKGYDRKTVNEICRIIACHRSEVVLKSGAFRRKNFADAAWAIVVIADKVVGDEDRVRPEPRAELARLRELDRVAEFTGSIHDRVNFAIKNASVVVDLHGSTELGEVILKLDIDDAVAKPAEIYTLYSARYQACCKGAEYLGFAFRLEFNGARYRYDRANRKWRVVPSIEVPQQ